jgi:hypothetical protein
MFKMTRTHDLAGQAVISAVFFKKVLELLGLVEGPKRRQILVSGHGGRWAVDESKFG